MKGGNQSLLKKISSINFFRLNVLFRADLEFCWDRFPSRITWFWHLSLKATKNHLYCKHSASTVSWKCLSLHGICS